MIYSFFAIRLLISRGKKLHYSKYWIKDKFLRTDIFGRIMNRDRYVYLLRMLYFSEITTGSSDKLDIKIREFCNKLRLSFKNNFNSFGYLCIDESLLLCKGRLSFRQYILSKRNRCGIKSFILCECKTGYVLNFIVFIYRQRFGSNKNNRKASRKIRGNCNFTIRTIFKKKHLVC